MNNPNPFVPKGSLLEQQSARRSRLKIAVGCALAVSVTGLVVMLIQGCKREQPSDQTATPPPDTNVAAMTPPSSPAPDLSSNLAAGAPSNAAPAGAPVAVPSTPPPMTAPAPAPAPMAMPAPAEAPAGAEYTVAQGDTLAKIAKANGVSLKALEAANPGVDPRKLKIKQKLVIPGKAGEGAAGGPATTAVTPDTGATGTSYTVKSGDTLSRIARRNGITLKALRAANNLTTDHIKVGQKLTVPAKAEAAAAPAAPTPDTSAAPAAPAPVSPAPAPAPGH